MMDLEKVKVLMMEKEIDAKEQCWKEHPANEGVFLRNLVSSEDTEGQFSCYIVRIKEGCQIASHIHEKSYELIQQLQGEGKGLLAEKPLHYTDGVFVVAPQGVKHEVQAVGGDLYLLAKFIPALG